MRLWHKDLIPYLPRKQLISQWRECCAIAGNIAKKGSPNHLLVNKILAYDGLDFWVYTCLVCGEIKRRGYKVSPKSFLNFRNNFYKKFIVPNYNVCDEENLNIFANWHNVRYLKQCLYNLQEKYDCGGISENEWEIIINEFGVYIDF